VDNAANLLLLALPLVLLILVFSRARRQQRELHTAQTSATPGSRIITTAGLHARVVEVDGDVVVLETAPGQHSRWAVQAIARVLEEPAADPSGPTTEDDDTPPRTADGEA
jgi:preprotein translocase subunit YajC